MKENDPPIVIVFIILFLGFSFVLGALVGSNGTEKFTREQTVNDCITHPKECKIEYDYYQLKNKEQS